MARSKLNRSRINRRLVAAAVPTLVLVGAASLLADTRPAAVKPAVPPAAPIADPAGVEFFEKNIRPLLAEQCFGCHNSKLQTPLGGLRLDSRAGALKGGAVGPAVVPGDPDKSLLIKAVRYEDQHLQMPPKGKLPAEKIQLLTDWIKMGAPWPGGAPAGKPAAGGPKPGAEWATRRSHWAFQAIKRPAVPGVRRKEWVRTPVDAFVLAKLEAAGLAPAPQADRRTLIRRLYFDLLGLPPTPEQVNRFLNDKAPDAYEQLVERLLASPQYGERWARHWLDLARFAETDGHEFDFEKPGAYQYRDYVIRAFNQDVPYDQFVKEHVAGDLLSRPRVDEKTGFNESLIATGFWWLGEGKHSPVDLRDEQAEQLDNQIDVFSKTFMGLSVGCARCHDHKFDPIPTKDYYALFGYLKSSRYQVASVEAEERVRPKVAELARLNDRLQPLLLSGMSADRNRSRDLEEMDKYLLAIRDAGTPEVRARLAPTAGQEEVFEDFESGTYQGWTATGTAFGDRPNRPPTPEYQGELNALGKGFVNSHSSLQGPRAKRTVGDEATGTLTSRVFEIRKPYIRFLVGGGAHQGLTCVNLVVDGKPVRTITGKNNNRMDWASWDVRDLAGKKAQIQVVDQVTGPWGNIGLDQITFSDSPTDSGDGALLARLAQERGLDAQQLANWVAYIKQAEGDPSDPLHAWAALAGKTGEAFEQAKAAYLAQADRPRVSLTPNTFEEFEKPGYQGWRTTGYAFGTGPAAEPAFRVNGDRVQGVVFPGVADSGRLGERLEGALRSDNFTIAKDRILFRMAGENCKVNLIIDNFQRIRFPIYGGLTIDVKGDRFGWYAMDVAQWKGHRAYLEFLDPGRGYIAVDKILFVDGDTAPATTQQPNALVLSLLRKPEVNSAEALARKLRDLITEVERGNNGGPEAPRTARAELLEWSIRRLGPPSMACGEEAGAMASLMQKRAQAEAAVPAPTQVIAMTDGPGEDEPVHIRGNYRTLGEMAPRRFMEVYAGPRTPAPTASSGRLELAQQMVSTSNPLLSRVMVNRIWQHHFGEGIVKTPDDFGIRGEKPTHPELLEWLSSTFMEGAGALGRWGAGGAYPNAVALQRFNASPWSIKMMHRLMVLSNAYRMSSQPVARAEAADPQNKLLHRMRVRRLEAEAVRDSILAVSGQLNPKMYGPGVLPFLTPFMEGRGRPGQSGPLDGAGRRSIYINVRRNFLTPMFMAFDYPIPFTTIGRRSVSTVPAQALTLMNNPFVAQQADAWAKRMLADAALDEKTRITQMYETAFSRPPSATELASAQEFLRSQEQAYGAGQAPKAWSDLAHVLINVKEFIFLN